MLLVRPAAPWHLLDDDAAVAVASVRLFIETDGGIAAVIRLWLALAKCGRRRLGQ